MCNPADQVNALVECASVNKEITDFDDARMADVEKLTEKLISDLREMTVVEVKAETEEDTYVKYIPSNDVKYSRGRGRGNKKRVLTSREKRKADTKIPQVLSNN